MKQIMLFLKDYKKESVLAPLFKMLEALFELFVPLVVAAIIDVGILRMDRSYIIKMCLILLFLAVIGLVCSITAQYYAAKAAVGCATELRFQLFRHILSLGYQEMDKTGSATLITRMTSDVNQVQNGINLALRLFLRSPFIVFGAMIMAFTIDVKSALIFAVTIPLLALVVFGIMYITRPIYQRIQQGLDKILGLTRENLTGARVIRAFHLEENEKKKFRDANDGLSTLQKLAGSLSGLTNPLTYIIINGAIIILVYTGAVRVNSGSLTQGQVVALYNYMSQILIELIKLANLIVSMTKAVTCANRINDIFDITPKMIEGTQENGLSHSETVVEFKKVSFQYEGAGEAALSDISFSVKRGQTIGIIGGTGSGKTSLINLIPRFYDTIQGEVVINGRNIREYTFEAIRNRVAVVGQKAQLFHGTIRENLILGAKSSSDNILRNALTISQSAEFVDSREKQLDTLLEQGGRNLSGGQKQRLTIARALVRRSEILILDDSASALDYATDAALRKAIRELEPAPTVFIVSQRAASVLYADQIIVLEDGKMAGIGTHEELLQTCSVYQEIYYSQFKKEVPVV